MSLDNVVHLGKAEVVTAINHVMEKEVQMTTHYTLEYSVHVIWKAPSYIKPFEVQQWGFPIDNICC